MGRLLLVLSVIGASLLLLLLLAVLLVLLLTRSILRLSVLGSWCSTEDLLGMSSLWSWRGWWSLDDDVSRLTDDFGLETLFRVGGVSHGAAEQKKVESQSSPASRHDSADETHMNPSLSTTLYEPLMTFPSRCSLRFW
jgi:hypothetical protein